MIIGKNLGFDLEQSRALCTQLNQYKEKKPPFDFPFGYEFEEAINWWNVIETKPLPNSLPLVALHLFAICSNSASCERGFSNLGDRKSTRLNSSHSQISYAVFCLKKKIIS